MHCSFSKHYSLVLNLLFIKYSIESYFIREKIDELCCASKKYLTLRDVKPGIHLANEQRTRIHCYHSANIRRSE